MSLYDVFRLAEIRTKLSYKFESVATMRDIVFVGTSDGRIVVIKAIRAEGVYTSSSCITVTFQNTKGKNPIKQMAAIADKGLLIVLTGGKLQVHSVTGLEKGGTGSDMVPEIGAVRGAVDVTGFHIKKEGGRFYLAAIHSKKKGHGVSAVRNGNERGRDVARGALRPCAA